ncbi:MAG TPA: hypothetical protein VNO55_30070, partial [Polyangia bacterium]|nr:hypothetical protein [Polyangia bacterium]
VRLTDSSGASCHATLNDAIVVTDKTTVALGTPAVTPPFGWVSQSTGVTIKAQAAATGFVATPRVYLNPANAGAATMATPLGAVAFTDKTQLTALVPQGLPVGAYDVIVVNPDGTVGVAAGAFNATAAAPPRIAALSPGSVSNGTGQTFTVSGQNFRQPAVALSCVDSGGTPVATNPTAAVSGATATSLTVTFDASGAGAACVVRVTNGDDKTYDEFSALVITNPAANLYAAKDGPSLLTARRAAVAMDGLASNAARFLYVAGGDDGAGAAFDTVEASALNPFGVPAAFAAQRNKLTRPRAFAGGARIGRFLYLAGGASGATRLDSIERAPVLIPEERAEVTDLLLEVADTGLGAGVWYYRVAAVMGPSDPFNPGGENLPSDPFPVRVPDLQNKKIQATVTWRAQPGATTYRVFRSPTAGATAGTEQLLAEVTAPAVLFKDTGAAPMATDTPLPVGSLGKWQLLGAKLSAAREGAGVSWAVDPANANQAYLYALGGRQDANTALASYDVLSITLNADGSQTPAASVTAVAQGIGTARWQLGAAQATHQLSPQIPAGTTYIYALSGVAANGTSLIKDTIAAPVKAGGQLGPLVDINGAAGLGSAGYGALVAGDFVFAFGGSNAGPDTKVVSGQICTSCNRMGMTVGAPYVSNFNAGQDMRQPRYLFGLALSGATVYAAGGVTVAGVPPQVSKTTEYRLW